MEEQNVKYRMIVYNEKRLKKTETEEKEDQGSVRV